ncbi:unnamed protein product [Leuciscus chuanchicus]
MVDGRTFIFDTPGIFDTRLDEEIIKFEIIRSIIECAPAVDAFVIVIKVQRCTGQEIQILDKIVEWCGEDTFKHAVVLFTHGEDLEDQSIEEFVKKSPKLQELVDKCGGRCHVIDNKHWNDCQLGYRNNRVHVKNMLETIDKMVKENGCYTNELMSSVEEDIQDEMNGMDTILLTPEEKREAAKKNVYKKYLIRFAGVATGTLVGAFMGIGVAVGSVVALLKAAKFKDAAAAAGTAGAAAVAVEAGIVTGTGAGTAGGAAAVAVEAGVAAGAGIRAAAGTGIAAGIILGTAALAGAIGGGITGYKAAEEADSVLDAIKMAAKANPIRKTTAISSQFSAPDTQEPRPTPSTANTPLSSFSSLTEEEVSTLLLSSHPTTCPLDPIPSHLLQAISPTLLPSLTHIINSSLHTGTFPTAFKQARVTPLLKKPMLNTSFVENYRPISLLPFIAKTLERAVFNQLTSFLSLNNQLDVNQSGFKKGHSTETALLSVTEALRIAKAASKSSVLILLDLSAAFDTVNHQILLSTLSSLGITGTSLHWFESYLTGRSFKVAWRGEVSRAHQLTTGVPQGSVLGPLLFSIYTTSMGHIIQAHGFSYHCYADDTQLFLSFQPDDPTVAARVSSCLADISTWMKEHHLQLNLAKTELLVLPANPSLQHDFTVQLESSLITPSRSVRNLGVTFDDQLTFTDHISKTARSCRFALHNIRKIRPFLTEHATQLIVQALVISRLDYCNALLAGLPACATKPLQMTQNAAARLVFNEPKRAHVTPLFTSLHWLPLAARIKFKALTLAYRTITGSAPSYFHSLLRVYIPTRHLRSVNERRLVVPSQKATKSLSRTFSFTVPCWWNALPTLIRNAESLTTFKKQLKTNLFLFLDDILVTGRNDEEHLQTLARVLERLQEAGLRLKRSKCSFMEKEVTFLGHKVDETGLHPVPEKVTAIQNAPSPKNVTELKAYLGLLNYYNKFLPNLSTVLAPVHQLLRKDEKWNWKEEQEVAFAQSKKMIQSVQVLVHYDPQKDVILSCDASPYGLGAVLSHKMPDGSERPIGFMSRTLNQAERNYSQLDKEGLAIMFGLQRFHKYLYGRSSDGL